ncbi:prostate and testis expressed protein 4-like [Mastomys coucha]|uniref:prostate and testis expressed protein 4-like n=1 Tax=Mastomys coucha TaxID=35658 RepID=UPI00126192AC|nr:prostate and testis expressed protein 4-like [Mastomys coucha]
MNLVTKISTLVVVTLSFLCFVEGLICNHCRNSKNSQCLSEAKRCTTSPGGSCSTTSYFVGQKHLYSKHECLSHCEERHEFKGDKLVYIMCCEKNLCNSF